MPRVHGIMDSGQRRHRRHRGGNSHSNNSSGNLLRGGGIFSLPTPFHQQLVNDDDDDDDVAASRSSSSCHGDGGNKNGGDGDDDSSILRVCDSRSSNKNDQASSSSSSSSSSSLSLSNDNAAVDADARASAVDEDTAIEDRGNDNADDGFHKCHNNQQQRNENECRKAVDGTNNDLDADDATTLALEGQENNTTDIGHDDEDDDGGSWGSSVDLLVDDDDDNGNDKNNNNDKNSLQQHHPHDRNVDVGQPIAIVQSSSLSPISPATKTLDRLSQFSSAKGGAELCMHLLADAAATVYASDTANNVGATIRGKSVENNGRSEEIVHTHSLSGSGSNNGQVGDKTVEKKCGRVVGANTERRKGTTITNASTSNNNITTSDDVIVTSNNGKASTNDIIVNKRLKCLRELKDYFMSTNNSSTYAKQQHQKKERTAAPAPPSIPFCLRCNHPSTTTTTTPNTTARNTTTTSNNLAASKGLQQHPHHGLCPHHADFFDSGSYEILNLIVDGYLLVSCKACMYQFDNCGRMDKSLCHADGCLRRNKSANKKSSSSSSIRSDNKSSRHDNMRGMDNANIMSSDVQPTNFPPEASKIDQMRKDGNSHVIIDPAADDINQTTPSPDHFDSSGHPLSEYERLRLRNIQRNNSRLDQLGLSAISRPSKHSDTKPKSSDSNKARSNKNMRPSAKRTNPRRTTTTLSLPEVSGKGTAADDTASVFAPSTSASAGRGRKSDPKGSNNTDEPKDTFPKAHQLLPRRQDDSNMLLERGGSAELSILRGRDKLANAGSTHQPTPSPLHHPQGKKSVTAMRGKNPPQIPALPPPPSWIKDFISEPIEMVPIPRGSKWLPCGNPWGKVGHEDDDVVIVSPFQSETMNDIILLTNIHQEMPKRFVSNPLELGSPYRATHCSPARGGYSVLRLRRDRSCLRPWGFTARLHEFGGACLIDSIEPLSPAEAAEDISGCVDANESSSLKPHDMIICVNGKCVGNMTMAELHIEFDICGSEMMLTVSRFDIPENDANEASETLQDLAMDWNDIGACSSLKRKRVSFEDDRSSSNVPHLFDVQPYSPDIEDDDIQENDHDNMNRGVEVDDWQNHVANPCHTTIAEIPMARNETHHLSQHAEDNIEPARSKSGMSPLTIHRESTTEEITKLEGRASLSMAAELGCRKCKRELRTGIKTNATHDLNCPRKFKPKSTTHRKSGRRAEHSMRVGKKGGHGSRRNPSKSRLQRSTSQKEEDTDASYIEETSDIDEIEFSSKRSTTNRPSRARTTDSNTLKYGNTKDTCDGKEDEEENSDSDEEDGDDDENPWLGCVCGSTHPHPIKVFWIQCEGCEAWYNAAEECLGFDEYAAQELSNWCCWACNPPVAGMGL